MVGPPSSWSNAHQEESHRRPIVSPLVPPLTSNGRGHHRSSVRPMGRQARPDVFAFTDDKQQGLDRARNSVLMSPVPTQSTTAAPVAPAEAQPC